MESTPLVVSNEVELATGLCEEWCCKVNGYGEWV